MYNSKKLSYQSDTQTEINLDKGRKAKEAVDKAIQQISACYEFKKPRLEKLNKYWSLYDGKTTRKLRQLFNVNIPVFAGMVDTLNAQYDSSIQLKFKEGDPSDYFKVQKINGVWQSEVMNSAVSSKWDSKLRMARKHAIINGRAFLEYSVSSDPEYKSSLEVISLKNFNFQPRGGLYLENHLFAGREDIEKTKKDLESGVKAGIYDKEQVAQLIRNCEDRNYLPEGSHDVGDRLSRFKPLGLDPENNSYVGEPVYKLCSHILNIDGERWYLLFHPWTKTWLRFEKWKDINSSGLYPWTSFATHEDDENFLSKSFGDDMYASADAIVAMFNQELTNREKRNFGARAYDKDMFPDVRKLDEAMHRPDAIVPVDTKGGTRQIGAGIYEFKTGELGGTVNLIDWITSSLGRNTGATDLSMGAVQEVSKKASVTFAEQKSVSKRIGWGSQPFQDMMKDLGKLYLYGLRDHMPAKMAIKVLGENGWDWDEITRMDLNTKRDIDVLIVSTDEEVQRNEMKAKKRIEILGLVDPNTINPKKRTEELLKVADYDDAEIAEFLDMKTYSDKKAIAKASEAMKYIEAGTTPQLWYGANTAFIEKIIRTAMDKRTTLGVEKFKKMYDYAMQHVPIAEDNIKQSVSEQETMQLKNQPMIPSPVQSTAQNEGVSGGVSRAMTMGEQMA